MRILFVACQTIGFYPGGIWTIIFKTKEALEKRGHEVVLFDEWTTYKAKDFDLAHLFEASLKTYFVATLLKENSFKMAVSSIFFRPRSAAMIRLEVATVSLIRRKLFGTAWAAATVCEMGDIVLPNSTFEADYVTRGFGLKGKKMEVIPDGYDPQFLGATPDLFVQKYGIKDFVMSAGSGKRKNFDILADACTELGVPLVLFGRNKERDIWDPVMERAKRNPKIIVIDQVPPGDPLLGSAYAACDTLALPADWETPGIVALEAASLGAKIVITPIGGPKDYFLDFAEYAEPRSLSSLCEALKKSLAKPKDGKLREHVLKNFTWDVVAEKTEAAYKRIVG